MAYTTIEHTTTYRMEVMNSRYSDWVPSNEYTITVSNPDCSNYLPLTDPPEMTNQLSYVLGNDGYA